MFHIIAINEKTGERTQVTASPMTHDEACTMAGKFGYHASRRIVVSPVTENADFRILSQTIVDLQKTVEAKHKLIGDLEDKAAELTRLQALIANGGVTSELVEKNRMLTNEILTRQAREQQNIARIAELERAAVFAKSVLADQSAEHDRDFSRLQAKIDRYKALLNVRYGKGVDIVNIDILRSTISHQAKTIGDLEDKASTYRKALISVERMVASAYTSKEILKYIAQALDL